MHKMRFDNQGMATIEITIIMSVMLVVLFTMIRMYLSLIDQSNTMTNTYNILYQYSGEFEIDEVQGQLSSSIKNQLVIKNSKLDIEVDFFDKNMVANVQLDNKKYCAKTECNKVSERLRRWQLYGYIVPE